MSIELDIEELKKNIKTYQGIKPNAIYVAEWHYLKIMFNNRFYKLSRKIRKFINKGCNLKTKVKNKLYKIMEERNI